MKKLLLTLSVASSLLFTGYSNAMDSKKTSMTARSWNVRRQGNEKQEKYTWPKRVSRVIQLVKQKDPDILGLQESIDTQIADLQKGLPDYKYVGQSRYSTNPSKWHRTIRYLSYLPNLVKGKLSPQANDEFNPIFYKTNKFKLEKSGTFNISHDGTAGKLPRIATWALLKDKQSGKEFYVYNTHFDNASEEARINNLNNLLAHITQNTKGYPVIVMGDFNTEITKPMRSKFQKAKLAEAKSVSQNVTGPKETRTGWDNSELKNIDHMFVTNETIDVKQFTVVETPGEFPSDHRPIDTTFTFKK